MKQSAQDQTGQSLIDDIKRDREAGTPGPWASRDTHRGPQIHTDHAARNFQSWVCTVRDNKADDIVSANARRIARVPDMEAALIAAEGLVEVIGELQEALSEAREGRIVNYGEHALAAYRKATEGKS